MTLPAGLTLSTGSWPALFDEGHRTLASSLKDMAAPLRGNEDPASCAKALGRAGLYRFVVPALFSSASKTSPRDRLDVRSLVLVREALGYVSPLADAILAVQGLGSFPLALAGSEGQTALLQDVISGKRIGAFGLTEPDAGSDVAAIKTTAKRDGSSWRLSGTKVFISNATIADHIIVFATTNPELRHKAITAFLVPRDAPGLVVEPMPMSSPHPLGRVLLNDVMLPASAMVGAEGQGFKLAMQTLDTFRISVGGAAIGMAQRALDLAVSHVTSRLQFGSPLASQQLVQGHLADMAVELMAARGLVARAAFTKDTDGGRVSSEAAMAKLYATEAAQRVIDMSVQLHGGAGCVLGSEVEALYRDIRPLRIYEGASDIQRLIIAKGLLTETSQASE